MEIEYASREDGYYSGGGSAIERASSRKSGEIHPGNFFGLENSASAVEAYGQDAFNKVLTSILSYAGSDKDTLRQLRDVDSTVDLPMVYSERLSGRLSLKTDPSGSNAISLINSEQMNNQPATGFHMVQTASGRVALIHADIDREREWTARDNDYTDAIDAVVAYCGEYFKQLDILKASQELNAETPYELRAALGERTVELAGHEIKLKRSDRSARKLLKKATRQTK